MTDIPLTSIIAFWAVLGIMLVGCRDAPSPQQPAQVSSGTEDLKPEIPDSEKKRSQAYVTCQATFTSLEDDHPWFEDGISGHDDGSAPLASFVLVQPANYANRSVGILFKYTGNTDTPPSPDSSDLGNRFTFQIPEDYLAGKQTTINNDGVRHFRKVEP